MPTARLCGVFVVNVCREVGTCVVRSKMNKFEHVWGAGPRMEGGTDTRALYRVVWGGGVAEPCTEGRGQGPVHDPLLKQNDRHD